MSWTVSAWVKRSKLGSGTRKGVMLVIADYCTEDAKNLGLQIPEGWAVCWAGLDVIAAESEYTERTVRRVLDDMEAADVVRREQRRDARGWRTYDLIWVQYGRLYVDLSDWEAPAQPDNSDRTQSPVGPSEPDDGPVDNPSGGARLADSDDGPTGLSRHGLPDFDAVPPHPPIRNNHHLEPTPNRQDHVGSGPYARAREAPTNGSSSDGGPAPPASGRPPPPDHRREERHG